MNAAVAEWLRSHRSELNQRFAAAQRRMPGLDPRRALARLGEVLPAIAGDDAPDALCGAVFDLVLLHEGRDTFAHQPGVDVVLREVLPQLRPLLAARPSLAGALSNAVEKLGEHGARYARALPKLAAASEGNPEVLLAAGAISAWRLGEARLRAASLAALSRLPGRAVLVALGLDDWPDEAAPLAVASLQGDGWTRPEVRVPPAWRRQPTEEKLALLRAPPAKLLADWTVRATVGGFAGFEGDFLRPPLVLDGGDRHTLHVRAGEAWFCIEADCYGWVSRPEPEPDLAVRTAFKKAGALKLFTKPGPSLTHEGLLTIGDDQATLPALAEATSYTVLDRLVAFTTPSSYRIRVLLP